MIGLVDFDFQSAADDVLVPPNIEIMKLATYYKKEENKFCRLVGLDETNLNNYEKIFFFSEQEQSIQIPANFLREKNVVYGGTAFTNGIYKPFENPIIDYTLPRLDVYKDVLKEKYQNGVKTKDINHLLDDTYYRAFASQEKLPIPAIRSQKRVFIYDNDFSDSSWFKIIEQITSKRPSAIYFIHPIRCMTLTQFFDLRKNQKIARTNKIILDLNIPPKEINIMLNKYKNYFLADISKTSNVYIPIGGSLATSSLYRKNFIYTMNLLYAFWSCGIPIKIKYEESQIGYNNPLKELEKLVESWSNNATEKTKTLKEKIVKKKKSRNGVDKDQMDLILKFNPEARELFDQTFEKLKGGYWRI